jgi:DNA-binding GntR family transcriptional regulator
VRNLRVTKHAALGRSFTDDMLSQGIKAGSKLIDYHVKRGEDIPNVASHLQLPEDDFIHCFTRLERATTCPSP